MGRFSHAERAVGVMREEGKIGECARVRTSSGIFKQLPPDPRLSPTSTTARSSTERCGDVRKDAKNQKIAFGKDINTPCIPVYIF